MSGVKEVNYSELLRYDESSPSCLRWKVNILSGRNRSTAKIKAGDIAGSLHKTGYWRVKVKGLVKQCHRIIYEIVHCVKLTNSAYIDHIDGNTQNNKHQNLRIVSRTGNNRNQRMRVTNSSGSTGVSFMENKAGNSYMQAKWIDCGVTKCKYFSIDKLGVMVAFRDAVIHRQKMIEELNAQGAGYTERHGLHLRRINNV